MILFRYAWLIALAIGAGQLLSACLAGTAKVFPEAWGQVHIVKPGWLQHPTHVVDVQWIRRGPPASSVRDGVCVLHLEDTREQDLRAAEALVHACLAAGGLQAPAAVPAGAVRLHWHVVANTAAVRPLYEQLKGGLVRPLGGFYYHPVAAGPCHVVTARTQRALGHEIKHCYDGAFHHEDGRWKVLRP